MRILLAGDTHTDVGHFAQLFNIARDKSADNIFVLGDFGFWPNQTVGLTFLRRVAHLSNKNNIPVYFLAGNHEDWDELDEREMQGNFDHQGFVDVYRGIKYAPTGLRWQWDNYDFLAVGGAYSVDRKNRVKYVSWFPQETISDSDVENCGTEKVGVLLSHDAPLDVDLSDRLHPGPIENRMQLQKIVDATNPNVLFHGHWHHRYYELGENYRVTIGLDCNQATHDSTFLLDTQLWSGNFEV